MSVSDMMMKITAILHHRLTNTVLEALRQGGVTDIYHNAGRASMLSANGGLTALLSGKRALESNLVDVLSLFVEPACELHTMRLIAHHGKLTRPGMGSVYSEEYRLHCAHPLCQVRTLAVEEVPDIEFYHDLIGIYCVVQRGQGDAIARVVLDMGVSVPTIAYGTGSGIRDRLGLLRITIPAEKEVLNLVVAPWDAEEVLEAMITAGRLDLPGRGFINTFKVRHALMNTKISAGRSHHAAASIEHIIAAIDSLKGGTVWRAGDEDFMGPRRRFFGGRDLNIICNDGAGVALVKAAMSAGGTGATLEKLKLLPCPDASGPQLSPAREICKLMVSVETMPAIIQAMEQAGALSDDVQAMIYHGEVPKAFTYVSHR
jgi:hypothetical protein